MVMLFGKKRNTASVAGAFRSTHFSSCATMTSISVQLFLARRTFQQLGQLDLHPLVHKTQNAFLKAQTQLNLLISFQTLTSAERVHVCIVGTLPRFGQLSVHNFTRPQHSSTRPGCLAFEKMRLVQILLDAVLVRSAAKLFVFENLFVIDSVGQRMDAKVDLAKQKRAELQLAQVFQEFSSSVTQFGFILAVDGQTCLGFVDGTIQI